jgi:hypothetical protein
MVRIMCTGWWLVQYKCSKYQKTGIAQDVYVSQGFGPVAFAPGADGTMGTVENKKVMTKSLHGNVGHVTTSPT